MTHSKQIAETVDYVLDDIITELGCEPDGHKTWAKTTDEIVETIKPILIEALQTAERRGQSEVIKTITEELSSCERTWELFTNGNKYCFVKEDDVLRLLASFKPTSEEKK